MNDSETHGAEEMTGPSPEVLIEILAMGKNFNEGIIEKVIRLYIPF